MGLHNELMHVCVKFEVSITNMSRVIDINVANGEKIWLPNVKYGLHDLHLLARPNYYED